MEDLIDPSFCGTTRRTVSQSTELPTNHYLAPKAVISLSYLLQNQLQVETYIATAQDSEYFRKLARSREASAPDRRN